MGAVYKSHVRPTPLRGIVLGLCSIMLAVLYLEFADGMDRGYRKVTLPTEEGAFAGDGSINAGDVNRSLIPAEGNADFQSPTVSGEEKAGIGHTKESRHENLPEPNGRLEELEHSTATNNVNAEVTGIDLQLGNDISPDGASNDSLLDEFHMLSERIPACAAKLKPPKTFLMLMSSHTGSTAAMSILNQHPDTNLTLDTKTFEPLNTPFYVEHTDLAADYARQLFEKYAGVNGKVFGFKLSAFAVMREKEKFAQLVRDFDTRIIFNYRTDTFKRAVGRYPVYFLGDETSVGGIKSTLAKDRCSMGRGCTFTVEKVRDLHCTMTRGRRVHVGMEEAIEVLTKYIEPTGCHMKLPYHDFLLHPYEVSYQLQDFLGLQRMKFEPKRAKATSDNICSVVKNYADLCAAFNECSAWRGMLNDHKNNCTCDQYQYTSLGGDGVNKFCRSNATSDDDPWCGNW